MSANIQVEALDYGQSMVHTTGVPVICEADGLVGIRMAGTDKQTGQERTMIAMLTPSEAADLSILLARASTKQRRKYQPPGKVQVRE